MEGNTSQPLLMDSEPMHCSDGSEYRFYYQIVFDWLNYLVCFIIRLIGCVQIHNQ